jgi:prepilin-type N-terminal cleavage/methylation domain-containing protein
MLKLKKGFTLVELLVVIAIIGMLSTIAVVSLGSARAKARDAKRIADMRQQGAALEQYYSDNSKYPSQSLITLGGTGGKTLCGSTGYSDTCTGTSYMGLIPAYPTPPSTSNTCSGTDPVAQASMVANNYCYWGEKVGATGNTGTDYTIEYIVESGSSTTGFGGGTKCLMSENGTSCI